MLQVQILDRCPYCEGQAMTFVGKVVEYISPVGWVERIDPESSSCPEPSETQQTKAHSNKANKLPDHVGFR